MTYSSRLLVRASFSLLVRIEITPAILLLGDVLIRVDSSKGYVSFQEFWNSRTLLQATRLGQFLLHSLNDPHGMLVLNRL